ncbi:MAG: SgcJ/EcaC family oxidoreductase [Gemmatimonadaceae bacterium]
MQSTAAAVIVGLGLGFGLTACSAAGRRGAPVAVASELAVAALADSILAAARARDAERFAAYFQPGEGLVYVLNTRRLSSQAAVREAFRAMLGRQREFNPSWTDRRVQVLAPGVAVFTGAFRTSARDTSGTAWGAEGVVTFAARLEPGGWRVVTWHTSERSAAP